MMRRKWMVLTAIAVGLMLGQTAWAAGSDVADVGITATVESFAEWADANTIAANAWDDTGTITAVNQAITATLAMTLYANVTTTIQPSEPSAGAGVLTDGTDVLTTSYMITGDVGTVDQDYKAALAAEAGQFFWAGATPNTYVVTHGSGDGSYAINLLVKAMSLSNKAPNAGSYTASVTLTASWS